MPLENLLEMYKKSYSLCEKADEWILGIEGDGGDADEINMSKLF